MGHYLTYPDDTALVASILQASIDKVNDEVSKEEDAIPNMQIIMHSNATK